tara:strand:+ start:1245 stop:1361 length:117 start_codon:yes stop_codon:yes gene_type:complete
MFPNAAKKTKVNMEREMVVKAVQKMLAERVNGQTELAV